jgi:hypothetical protein
MEVTFNRLFVLHVTFITGGCTVTYLCFNKGSCTLIYASFITGSSTESTFFYHSGQQYGYSMVTVLS